MASSKDKRAQQASPQDTSKQKKRKAITVDSEDDSEDTKTKRARKKSHEEKRLKRFRAKAPITYLERLGRVKTQRMFLLDRNRSISEERTHEEEVFDIAGSTGNIYNVTISKVPTCSCPDAARGNQCKHIIYVSRTCSPTKYSCSRKDRLGSRQHSQSPRRLSLPTRIPNLRTIRDILQCPSYTTIRRRNRNHHRHRRTPQTNRRRLSRLRYGIRGI